MLSSESQALLGRIMTTLGETELRLEASRRAWKATKGIDSEGLFRKLDHLGTGFITIEDFALYLAEKQIRVPLQEQLFVFSWFDADGDGRASYQDFVRRLLPVSYPRDEPAPDAWSSPDTDFEFLSLMLKELECVKAVLKLASEFVTRPDFSLSRAFFAVSKGKKDIGNIVLGRFLEQALGKTFPQEMLYAIIERLDLDNDGRISQKDMSVFLQRLTNTLQESERKPSSPLKTLRVRDPENLRFPAPEQSLPTQDLPSATASDLTVTNPYISFLSRLITLQKSVETARQHLAVEDEIGLQSVFRSFDKLSNGQLTLSDFEYGLDRLSARYDYNALCLLLRHYDSDRDGYISQADFCRMLLTAAPEYSELYTQEGRRVKSIAQMSEKAVATLARTFDALLAFELGLEQLRADLVGQVDYRNFFRDIDLDKSDTLTYNDFKQFLASGGVFPSLFEVVALIELLDTNRDGKVDYSEFVDVLAPKSPDPSPSLSLIS